MKKAISIIFAMLMVMPFAFADYERGDRISTFDEEDAYVGEFGYVDISNWNSAPDVYVCATKKGKISSYGMNLQNDVQFGEAIRLIRQLASMSFDRFDHFGCLRARI